MVTVFAQCFLISFKVQLFNIVTISRTNVVHKEDFIVIVQLNSQLA